MPVEQRFAAQGVANPRPHVVPAATVQLALKNKFLREWTLMKRARFNAAKRYERKYDASILSFAIAGIMGFVVPFYTLTFSSAIEPNTKSVLDFTAQIIGVLSLVIGLIEQAKDYPAKIRRFDECGRQINKAVRRLSITPVVYDEQLQPHIQEYEAALDACEENHDDIDYDMALAAQAIMETPAEERQKAERTLILLKWKERAQIYWLYWLVWCLPAVFGLWTWYG
jgi:hypothetical protein